MAYTYQPYPRSLYRREEGAIEYNGVPCKMRTVESEEEEAAAKKDGWRGSPEEAGASPFDHDGDAVKKKSRRKRKAK